MISKPKYIYVIGHDDALKIGYSSNPHGRVKQLQTANESHIRLLWSMQRNDAAQLEKHLHRTFKKHHIQGEWFSTTLTIEKIKAESYGYTKYDW